MARSKVLACSLSLASLFFKPVLGGVARRDLTPGLPIAEGTTRDCDFWYDNDGSVSCDFVPDFYGCTLQDFFRWNPSLKSSCSSFPADLSYCVEGPAAPASTSTKPATSTTSKAATSTTSQPVVSSTSKPTSTTSTSSTTSKAPSNGIQTPEPVQSGIVDNCDEFYLVKEGEGCEDIAKKHGITLVQFTTWNSEVGSTCTGLWKDEYACVSIIGHTPTPTNPGNGITTPLPIQEGMTSNCNKFHLTKSDQSCSTLQSQYQITFADLYKWNPAIGPQCTALWLDTNVCVGIIGGTPTNPGNGITTPQPVQEGMTNNCNKFHLVKSGQSCSWLQNQYKVTLADLYKWNPAIGPQCTSLWLDTNVCVGVAGGTPTNPGNGVTTPQPIQDGMTKNCKKFHFVRPDQTCRVIQDQYNVSFADLYKWNPAIGSACNTLWANTNLCIGV